MSEEITARKVLIAEDEALIRMDLAETLAELGYEVVAQAADGEEQAPVFRAALGEVAGRRDWLRASDSIRRADCGKPQDSVQSHRCRVLPRAVHPSRFGGRRVGFEAGV